MRERETDYFIVPAGRKYKEWVVEHGVILT